MNPDGSFAGTDGDYRGAPYKLPENDFEESFEMEITNGSGEKEQAVTVHYTWHPGEAMSHDDPGESESNEFIVLNDKGEEITEATEDQWSAIDEKIGERVDGDIAEREVDSGRTVRRFH